MLRQSGVADRLPGRVAAIHGARGYDLDTWRRGIYQSTQPHLSVGVEELEVPDCGVTLLLVRVPKGDQPPYGTAQGVFKQRVGKNCMPLHPATFTRMRIATGSLDWSGEPAADLTPDALDPVEIARARSTLASKNPESALLRMDDGAFLAGLEAVRAGLVPHTGLLLFRQTGCTRQLLSTESAALRTPDLRHQGCQERCVENGVASGSGAHRADFHRSG